MAVGKKGPCKFSLEVRCDDQLTRIFEEEDVLSPWEKVNIFLKRYIIRSMPYAQAWVLRQNLII